MCGGLFGEIAEIRVAVLTYYLREVKHVKYIIIGILALAGGIAGFSLFKRARYRPKHLSEI